MSPAARADDRGRFSLLDDGRPLDFLADWQFVVVIDRRIAVPAEFTEIDRPRAFLGFGSLPAVRPGNVVLFAAGTQAPRDHLNSRACDRAAEQFAIELVEIVEQL